MLSFLKKKTDGSADQTPAWHPNFRNYERLPDIKVVRTAFFVNGATAFVAIALAVYLGMREYELHSLTLQQAQMQDQIDATTSASTQAIAQFNKFREEENRAKEVDTFLKSKVSPSRLLVRLAETRPENIAIDQIDIRDNGINIKGSVKGELQAAYGDASRYVERLRNDEMLKPISEDVSAVNAAPNPQTGRLAIEVFVRFPAAAKK